MGNIFTEENITHIDEDALSTEADANAPEFQLNRKIFVSENVTTSEIIAKFLNSTHDILSTAKSPPSNSSLTQLFKSLNQSSENGSLRQKSKKNKKKNEEVEKKDLSLPTKSNIIKKESSSPQKRNIKFYDIVEDDDENDSPRKFLVNDITVEQAKKAQEEPKIKTIAGSLMRDIRKTYKFNTDKNVGQGHFGSVRKGYRRGVIPRKYYAIKSISKKQLSQKDLEDLIKEVDIIASLDHPNIVKFYETYHDNFYFHIVMELCTGNELLDHILNEGKLSEEKVCVVITKVLHAISYCHSRGVTHRDLKPENILFQSKEPDSEIKLIDFGLSRKYNSEEKMHTILGTPFYVAPEVLKGEYDEKCDIWSIGALSYIMLCGEPPFKGTSNNEIFTKILNEEVKFSSKWKNISDEAKNFVMMCLRKNPEKRPNAMEALLHPWFSGLLAEIHDKSNLTKEILINLKNFKITELFKQIIMKYLVNMLSEKEIKKYKMAFYAMDIKHNGTIEETELEVAFKEGEVPITKEEIKGIISIVDESGKGSIDYTEFLVASINQDEIITKEKLKFAFNYFDVDSSGSIDEADLANAMLRFGKKIIHMKDVTQLIKEVTSDEKDKINLEEFYSIFNFV